MTELHPKNPNMYLTRSYTSSMMAMVDMMDLIRPDHVQSHLGKFCDDCQAKPSQAVGPRLLGAISLSPFSEGQTNTIYRNTGSISKITRARITSVLGMLLLVALVNLDLNFFFLDKSSQASIRICF